MRVLIFAVVILFFLDTNLNAQNDISAYLRDDDLKGFIEEYSNKNDSLAISYLIQYPITDTIGIDQIWYNETTGKGINPFERSVIGPDYFYASLKLKSYFWILQIFNKDTCYDMNKACLFYENDNCLIFDYELIGRTQHMKLIEEIFTGKSKGQKLNFKYVKLANEPLAKLNERFEKWYVVMNNKGLKELRRQNIPPIVKNRYKVFSP